MKSLSNVDLVECLNAWLQQRLLQNVCYVQGGWEAWMEVDLVAFLYHSVGNDVDIQREVDVLDKRVDLVINANSPASEQPVFLIEVKCQTPKAVGFVSSVMADWEKLAHLKEQIIHEQRKVIYLSLVYVVDGGTQDALVQVYQNRPSAFQFASLSSDGVAYYLFEI